MKITAKTRKNLNKALFVLAALALLGITERTAMADPLVFSNLHAFQNNDTTQVNLFLNPGTTLLGTSLTFSVDISGTLAMGATDILRITYQELGGAPIVQDFQIPLFGTVNPPFTLIFSIVSPGSNPLGTPATLTLDLLNSAPDFLIPGGPNQGQMVNSFTYSFNVQPVPEPATLLALASGFVALGIRTRRRE
jgi:PEP-CTERM motif